MKFGLSIGMLIWTLALLHGEVAQAAPDRTPAEPAASGGFSVSKKLDTIGNVDVGSSLTDSVIVTNTAKTMLTITSVTSSNARFTVSPTSGTIAGNGTKVFRITFSPLAAGLQTSLVIFKHSGPTVQDTVTAVGTGTAPTFSVNRKSLPFGFVPIASAKADSVTVKNTGTSTLVISNVTLSNASFAVNPTIGSLAPGVSKSFRITFAPTSAGSQTGNVIFIHNGLQTQDTVAVSGSGTAFSVNRRSVGFGIVPVGTTGKDSVFVTNVGPTTLNVSSVVATNGVFDVSPSSATIPATTTKTFYITYAPMNPVTSAGSVIFTHSSTSSPDTVAVSGTGLATNPGFQLNTSSVSFGTVSVGNFKTDSVIVTNTGSKTLLISHVGSGNGMFAVNPISDSVQPSHTRTFQITFTPTASGPQLSNIVFTHNAPGSPDTAAASGTAVVNLPAFSVNRRTVPFGPVAVGELRTDSVVVTNTGQAALLISNVTSTNGAFVVHPTNDSLPPSQSRTFFIVFTPLSAGTQSGDLVFTHNALGSPDSVAFTGTGIIPGFSLDRRSLAFGYVPLGWVKIDSVTVTNSGTAPLTISNVTSNNTFFTVNPPNAVLSAGAPQKFVVSFAPTTATDQAAKIVFTHDAPGQHDTVSVNGSGTSAAFTLSRTNISFGYVTVGADRRDSVLVTNAGTSPLVITSVISTNSAFAVQPGSGTIQPGKTQSYVVDFAPANINPQTGYLVFVYNAGGSPDTVTLSGSGTVAVFSINKRMVAFGSVRVGTTARDSVVVTNTGASTLTITNVSSGNSAFAVSPTNASVATSAHATFQITYTPADSTSQNSVVVFTHIAVSSPDSIRVTGSGSLAKLTFDRKSVSFGYVQLGGYKADSIVVTNPGTTPLMITQVTSDNSAFSASPGSATVQPGGSKFFAITCSPRDTLPQVGHIMFANNGGNFIDTVLVAGTGVIPLPAPALVSPTNGAVGLTLPLVLNWSGVAGATGYVLEIATDTSFSTMVLSDASLVGSTRQVNNLPRNAKLYWRVRTRNVAGAGPGSAAWNLTMVPSGHIQTTIDFSGTLSAGSYRLFGLPGVGTRTVGSILTGSRNVDWRILRDTGRDTTYPSYYEDLTADSSVKSGEGYWLLAKTNQNISRVDTLAPLRADGTFSIPVHDGWNIISDPFDVSVAKSDVIRANGLPPTTVFWEYNGTTTSAGGTTIDPFKGYYFFNDSVNTSSLRFPYPFSTAVSKTAGKPIAGWRVELRFDGDNTADRDNYLGVEPGTGVQTRGLEQHEPPLFLDKGFLYFPHPDWDAKYSRFATDIRPALGEGQTWTFEVWNPHGGPGKITLDGADAIPDNCSMVLVNALNSVPVDMRRTDSYSYETVAPRMRFALIIGTEEYVRAATSALAPQSFELWQNYPNPFNPKTVVSGQWSVTSVVRLAVYDVLGREVAVLADGRYPAGKYSFTFDGSNLSSGVYFCRLTAGGFTAVRKMTLIK